MEWVFQAAGMKKMIPFDEKGFEASVSTVLQPWLRTHVTGGVFASFDDSRIRYYKAVHPDAKAVIVMLHGFCEFFGKFHETAYDFWENGYTVYFIEQRGHGGSERLAEDPDVVDVVDFSHYVEDLKCFLDRIVLPEMYGQGARCRADLARAGRQPGQAKDGDVDGGMAAGASSGPRQMKLLLYAHSMGSCVSTLFLEKYPEYFYAAVLSSPMLKMTFGKTPLWQVKALMGASRVLGWDEKPMPGMQKFDPDKPDFEGSGSTSLARFMYQFALRKDPASGGIYTMNGGTYRWGRAAHRATLEVAKKEDRIRIPLLVCQAGKDVYVDNEGQNELSRRAKHVKLVQFPEAEHEIYASDPASLEKYYKEVLGFFKKASEL